MQRGRILDEAKNIINGARQDQYGNPEDSFSVIGDFWSVYVKNNMRRSIGLNEMGNITGKDVALMMALMKIGREINGAGKADNLIDACGYLALAADMSSYDGTEGK